MQRHAGQHANPEVDAISCSFPEQANPQVGQLPFNLCVPSVDFSFHNKLPPLPFARRVEAGHVVGVYTVLGFVGPQALVNVAVA